MAKIKTESGITDEFLSKVSEMKDEQIEPLMRFLIETAERPEDLTLRNFIACLHVSVTITKQTGIPFKA